MPDTRNTTALRTAILFIPLIISFFLCLLFLTGCSTTTSARKNSLDLSNGCLTIGYRFDLERHANESAKLTSFMHLGVPLWIDAYGQNQACLSLSSLCITNQYLYGLQIAPIASIEHGKGLQCAFFGWADTFDGLLVSPISFAFHGDCLQVGLLSISGMLRGSTATFGQISIINFSGIAPRFQAGLLNAGEARFSPTGPDRYFQVGFWNLSGTLILDEEPGTKGGNIVQLASYTQCGFVNVTDGCSYSDSIKIAGNQFGFVNVTNGSTSQSQRRNLQCGLFNYLEFDDTRTMQVGLINKKGKRLQLFYNK